MWARWVKNLKEARGRDDFKDVLIASLQERQDELTTKELDPNLFGSPAWPYLQAAQIGARKEITNLIKLLALDHKE